MNTLARMHCEFATTQKAWPPGGRHNSHQWEFFTVLLFILLSNHDQEL